MDPAKPVRRSIPAAALPATPAPTITTRLTSAALRLPARHGTQRRSFERLTRSEAEARVVPWAPHRVAHDEPFAQRSAVVRAGCADREELAAAPRHEYGLTVGVSHEHPAFGDAGHRHAGSEVRPLQFLFTTHRLFSRYSDKGSARGV